MNAIVIQRHESTFYANSILSPLQTRSALGSLELFRENFLCIAG